MANSLTLSLSSDELTRLKAVPPGKDPYDFFWSLIFRHFKLRALGLVMLSVAGIGFMAFEPVLMKSMINTLSQKPANTADVWFYFTLIVGAWYASSLANRLRDWLDIHTGPEIRKRAQLEVYCWLEGHSQKFFEDHLAGSLSQKVKQAGAAMISLTGIIFDGFIRVIMAIILAAIILSTAPGHFFWIFIAWLASFLMLSAWFAKRCVPLFKDFGDQVSESTGTLVDITRHMQTVRSSVKTIRGVGYDLVINKRLASGPDATFFTKQQAEKHCSITKVRHASRQLECRYAGKTFYQHEGARPDP